ncbi:MAG: hypothetical protein PHX77_06935 [Candidatus Bipolaricaulis sp.]|nr:hypothetical protein [Candidatus Bipolaricaulis sp.]
MGRSREVWQHVELGNAYAQAESSCREGRHEAWYSFAGRAVRIRCVGHQLAERLAMPLSHLQCEPPNPPSPSLTIDLWSECETGVAVEPAVAVHPEGATASYSASEDGRFATSVLPHSVSSFDRESGRIVGSALGVEGLSLYEWGRPLHVPLSLWYNDRGVPLVHSAFVAQLGDGVLLAGSSAAGKTTSSLSCVAGGFQYLADDLAALEIRDDGTAWGHSVYASAFVDGGTIARVGGVSGMLADGAYPHEDKRLLILPAGADGPLRARARIRAVALLRISTSPATRFHRLLQGEALLAMLRDGLQTGALHPGRIGLERLADLAERVPAYRVDVGTKAAGIPVALRAMLADAGRPLPAEEPV